MTTAWIRTFGSESIPVFHNRLAVIADVLPRDRLQAVTDEIERLPPTERSYLPAHKKGGAVAYHTLRQHAPRTVELYHSVALRDLISQIVRLPVEPTPLHDESSCSVLFYERPGDHIGWHFDHNFYKGRHFTVLIPILNFDRTKTQLSSACLFAKIGNLEQLIPTPPNALIVFEGARVLHKATPISEGERRILLSMTFCADPRNSLPQEIARRFKDTAFFGLRTLWGGKAQSHRG